MNLPVQPDQILAERYQLHQKLGSSEAVLTYLGQDSLTAQAVIIKLLNLGRLPGWKALELFEREIQLLNQLQHNAIPKVLDHFMDNASQSLALVMSYIPGQSLQAKYDSGWRPDEAEIKSLLTQALEILVYLQDLHPAVIHRDIKPSNLILDHEGNLHLIDFGSVQAALTRQIGQSESLHSGPATVVGTFGFMPPEQYLGQAGKASDLYSLGVSMISLLSTRELSALVSPELKLNFRPYCEVSRDFADILAQMTEPDLQQRFKTAQEVLAVLNGALFPTFTQAPADSCVMIEKSPQHLLLKSRPHQSFRVFSGIALLSGLSLFHYLGLILGPSLYQGGFFGLISLSLLLPLLMLSAFSVALSLTLLSLQTELLIGPKEFRRVHTLLGLRFYRTGETADLADCVCPPGDEGRDRSNWLGRVWLLEGGRKQHDLGFGQRAADRDWVCAEVRQFLLQRTTLARSLAQHNLQALDQLSAQD